MAVSRLDRLFILLDTGTTPVTRKAAAQQLGEVVKLHPHELTNLLSKVLIYLRSPNWDTRIAAGQAVEAIVKHVPEWNPPPRLKRELGSECSNEDSSSDRLSFDRFDISRLLKHGASLLGSAGVEFEFQDDKMGEIDPKERRARQKKLLQKKLGLDMGAAIGMNTEELFNDEDLDYTPTALTNSNKPTLQAAEIIDSEFLPGMSNRQKNKAKRMAKLIAKQKSRDATESNEKSDSTDGEPEEKRRKVTNVVINQPATESKVLIDNVPDNSSLFDEVIEWPLESFCEELCNDLFNPSWEIRHGAGTGLREILKVHGRSGGRITDSTPEEMEQQHQEWLEDLVIRLLCVFALDRFGDFVSDEVVAPVRETCAQTLGVVLKHMNESGVHKTVKILLRLLTQEQWEVRHGGLLGIKYALAVRQDLIKALLPKVLPAIIEGLQDLDDDVRAVAAASLVPVVDSLVKLQFKQVSVSKVYHICFPNFCSRSEDKYGSFLYFIDPKFGVLIKTRSSYLHILYGLLTAASKPFTTQRENFLATSQTPPPPLPSPHMDQRSPSNPHIVPSCLPIFLFTAGMKELENVCHKRTESKGRNSLKAMNWEKTFRFLKPQSNALGRISVT